ncbi:MAG TPA: formylglycine-generating enzyme family protein [Chthoniobacterales bacterium]
MPVLEAPASPLFPDDPRKWDGWSKYQAANPYDRLCLDASAAPSDVQIQQHYTALLQWWQKKLPLKNQPTNPLAQLLGRGIDESSRFLVEARMQLLDPERRRQIDEELAAKAREKALADFAKYVAFTVSGGVLTAEGEANLIEFGESSGIPYDEISACIEEQLRGTKAKRCTLSASLTGEAEKEFIRLLRLGGLNLGNATESVREIVNNVAENLGIDFERATDLLDDYLDKEELILAKSITRNYVPSRQTHSPRLNEAPAPKVSAPPSTPAPAQKAAGPLPPDFLNPLRAPLVLIPAGEFIMGSNAPDAAPNEQPLTPVKLSPFYISVHLVTNAQYEQFDPTHRQKRMTAAGDQHPVVYVSSLDAIKFCRWLGEKDGRKYRLPSEAEWEYAARGNDGRKYPWGRDEYRNDLANFADASTAFAWRETRINDGFPESSPIGAFPRGTSFFGIYDMAGNVWEWCLDFYQPLPGSPKQNPRGPGNGLARVYRGGSWKSRFSSLRATARGSNAPNYCCNDLGFRIVCEIAR